MNKIISAVVGLALLVGTAACRTEVGVEDCKGAQTVTAKYRNGDGYWTLGITCAEGGSYVVQWKPSDGDPDKGVGPAEWERAQPGTPYIR